jgi:two-component system copper resistance phosphate regulon response regulator CusR
MRILIAEDDAALAGFVRQGLVGEHYAVDVVEDGEQARAMGSEFDYDLVILDLNLPKLDGVSVLRHLRLKRPSLPVLVLTQRSRVEDRVQCLDTGADDYLPKPFSFSELSARIRALLRRSHLPSESVLVVEDLHLDRVEHRAERAGRRIELTSKEFSLLEYLMRNAGRQVSRAMIIEHVWNLTLDTTTNVVDVYIFGRWQKVESLRGAVVSLGFHHVSDIAMSCGVLKMLPGHKTSLDPAIFWEHSLGCALVCRHLARKINLADPGKAYLAGLLHDLGIIVNLWVLPQEFRTAYEMARAEEIPLHEAEQDSLGFTHCDSGRLLAESWGLAPDLVEVVSYHHSPEKLSQTTDLVALVHVADLLCRMSGLNYGYAEARQVNLFEDAGFDLLAKSSMSARDFDWARLTFELDSYLDEVHSLVRAIYRTSTPNPTVHESRCSLSTTAPSCALHSREWSLTIPASG